MISKSVMDSMDFMDCALLDSGHTIMDFMDSMDMDGFYGLCPVGEWTHDYGFHGFYGYARICSIR